MKKAAVEKLHKDILLLAHEAFSLDLYMAGKKLCDCAEHIRQLLVVAEGEKTE